MKAREFYFIFYIFIISATFFSESTFAQTIFIHPETHSENQFQNQVNGFKGISIVDFIRSRYQFNQVQDYSSYSTIEKVQLAIQDLEAQPLLRGDCEILLGLYQKIYLQNPKSAPLSRIAGIFLSHPKMQEYYFDFWDKIKTQIKIIRISEVQVQEIKNMLNNKRYLMIDGKEIRTEDLNEITALPHQWFLFSNTTLPVVFNGTIDGFINFAKEPKRPTDLCFTEIQPFPSVTQFQITVLNGDVSCAIHQQTTTTSKNSEDQFYAENKNWLIPTGIGLGVLLFLGPTLKDKKISVKLPGFTF